MSATEDTDYFQRTRAEVSKAWPFFFTTACLIALAFGTQNRWAIGLALFFTVNSGIYLGIIIEQKANAQDDDGD